MFTRCLKRRPDEFGKFKWQCRRATFKFKCFRRKPVELKEPTVVIPPMDDEDPPSAMYDSRR